MKKMLLVLKNEFITTIRRRSFIITLLAVPLISLVVMLVISVLGKNTGSMVSQVFSPAPKQIIEGYVDENGLIRQMPGDGNQSYLIKFADRTQASQALQAGEITGYYIVPTDYIAKGDIYFIQADFNPISSSNNFDTFRAILRYNLLGGDANLVQKYENAANTNVIPLAPVENSRDQSNLLSFFLPYAVTMIFYVVILTAASFMLNSVTSEKTNRVLEILMVSVTPVQMLTGKIIALGLVGLLQTIAWSGSSYLLLRISGRSFDLGAFQLPPSILFWGLIFFVLGYAVYASLMAGIGALVPNLREASQATTVVIIPMIIPLMLISLLINAPDSPISIGLSLFPLTAPTSMMTRLAASNVPIWQILVSIGLLIFTAYLTLKAVAGMFRAQTLLSGQTFNMRIFFKALLGQG